MKKNFVKKVVSVLLAAMIVAVAVPETQVEAYSPEGYPATVTPHDDRPTRPPGGNGGL